MLNKGGVMLIKNRNGWDIVLGDGEGCQNIKRHELESLQVDISCALINEDFGERGQPCSK
jgi:hypothetical protein